MIQSKVYKLAFVCFLFVQTLFAQVQISGIVINEITQKPINGVEVYSKSQSKTVFTNTSGEFVFNLETTSQELVFINYGFEILEYSFDASAEKKLTISLVPLSEKLSEVVIDQQKEKVFGIKNLKNVEGTAIYAGKKTEVVLVDQLVTNKASGNPRQAYAQVAGLNIYETDDGGLQLNVGGRGLDPNRSANFNTRQNGYDISADVLGYPESYYTPPLEALKEIQIVRGAASLQYGTQFGGLINFKLNEPNPTKKIELISRQGFGSFGLFNSFNSLSGTVDKASYYTYFQYKKGDGFRENSNFESKNVYAQIGYDFTDKTKLTFESTYLTYLAQQAGGLSDAQFLEDPTFSNRTRNFFKVDWILLNLKLAHKFSQKTEASLNVFKLNASRKALGFREDRTTITDDINDPRELLVDDFNNWGAEARLLTRYEVFNKPSVFLIGSKYYQSINESQQGIGNNGVEADFTFKDELFPDSDRAQSEFDFPNLNVSVFAENIINITDEFSVTPGLRFEYINTEADGFFSNKIFDGAGNLLENQIVDEVRENERSFALLGLGLSYKPSNAFELFANFSQNYRSVTFSDIRVDNPSLIIDENLTDETGFTGDIGIRGQLNTFLRYDISAFSLLYDNRIGTFFVRQDSGGEDVRLLRTNVGTAQIFGLESLVTLNFSNWLLPDKKQFHWQQFLNLALTESEYTKSESENLVGNEVEFIPIMNLKTGLELGYKDFKSSLQFTYVSTQFTDALNTPQDLSGNSSTVGEIPSYSVMDFSAEYTYKNFTLEAGVNNLLDESYFTRRATGYPGPGIIPSSPRNFYVVLQIKL